MTLRRSVVTIIVSSLFLTSGVQCDSMYQIGTSEHNSTTSLLLAGVAGGLGAAALSYKLLGRTHCDVLFTKNGMRIPENDELVPWDRMRTIELLEARSEKEQSVRVRTHEGEYIFEVTTIAFESHEAREMFSEFLSSRTLATPLLSSEQRTTAKIVAAGLGIGAVVYTIGKIGQLCRKDKVFRFNDEHIELGSAKQTVPWRNVHSVTFSENGRKRLFYIYYTDSKKKARDGMFSLSPSEIGLEEIKRKLEYFRAVAELRLQDWNELSDESRWDLVFVKGDRITYHVDRDNSVEKIVFRIESQSAPSRLVAVSAKNILLKIGLPAICLVSECGDAKVDAGQLISDALRETYAPTKGVTYDQDGMYVERELHEWVNISDVHFASHENNVYAQVTLNDGTSFRITLGGADTLEHARNAYSNSAREWKQSSPSSDS